MQLRFWCDFSFAPQAKSIISKFDQRVRVDRIVAGKLRRYHHLTLMQQLLWPSLVLKNFGDGFLVAAGIVQSIIKLIVWRPDVVFTKGGYVCLPVGFAAHLLRIPLVIHDSDAHPGLTNRILSRWATTIATGAPLEYYHYDATRSHYVGIPVDDSLRPISHGKQQMAKKQWGIDTNYPLIVVTGGGLGAKRINDAVAGALPELLRLGSVVLVAGKGQYDALSGVVPTNSDRFQLHAFVTEMPSLLSAADIVIARAGATTILELSALEKPTILIPNGKLTGGHQLKNAAVYQEKEAIIVVDEDQMEQDPKVLLDAIEELLRNPKKAHKMAKAFHEFSRPDAAHDMANLILKARR